MPLTLYLTTVTTNTSIKKRQSKLRMILDSKGIYYDVVDLSKDSESKDEMRERIGEPTALPPQIFNDSSYCGSYESFMDAVEEGKMEEFLKLKRPCNV